MPLKKPRGKSTGRPKAAEVKKIFNHRLTPATHAAWHATVARLKESQAPEDEKYRFMSEAEIVEEAILLWLSHHPAQKQ